MFCDRKLNKILGEHTASIYRDKIKDAHIIAVVNMTAFDQRTLSHVRQLQTTNLYNAIILDMEHMKFTNRKFPITNVCLFSLLICLCVIVFTHTDVFVCSCCLCCNLYKLSFIK